MLTNGCGLEPIDRTSPVLDDIDNLQKAAFHLKDMESQFLLLTSTLGSGNAHYAHFGLYCLYLNSRNWALRPGLLATRTVLKPFLILDGIRGSWVRFNKSNASGLSQHMRSILNSPCIEEELRQQSESPQCRRHTLTCLGILGTPGAIELLRKIAKDHPSEELKRQAERELVFLGEAVNPIALLTSFSSNSTCYYLSLLALAIHGDPIAKALLANAIESEEELKHLKSIHKGHPHIFRLLGDTNDLATAITQEIL